MYTNKIVIVDDSKAIATFLASALKSFFQNVTLFNNPIQALAAIPEINPDCIITDYQMPEMKGTELVAKIKANPLTKDIPVLILSSNDDDSVILEAIEAGADDYLSKRINPEVMLSKIKLCLEVKKYREMMVAAERTKAYNATIISLNHELNNAAGIVMLTLGHLEKSKGNLISDEDRTQIDRLRSTLKKMLNAISEFSKRDSVEYEQYGDGNDAVMISPKNKK